MTDANAKKKIRVTATRWRRLNALKRPGESFDDVVERLLDAHDEPLLPEE